jgi:hypothetical protein
MNCKRRKRSRILPLVLTALSQNLFGGTEESPPKFTVLIVTVPAEF